MAMVVQGVDYSQGWTKGLPAALVAGGYKFVMRYISRPANPKNLQRLELAALQSLGLGVGIVFETTTLRALQAGPGGEQDAVSAQAQLVALGLSQAAVYFAVDFDATAGQIGQVVAYVKAAAARLGHGRAGVYGGIGVVDACAAAQACAWFWQTSAWSHGEVSAHADLYQHTYDQKVAGVQVDINDLLKPEAGITWPKGTPPAPVPH